MNSILGENIETEQKYGAGQNKHTATTMNTTKLDRETEELKHEKVDMKVGLLIQKGRQAKGWSQKELATKICEKPQVVNEYEASKAVPNQVSEIFISMLHVSRSSSALLLFQF